MNASDIIKTRQNRVLYQSLYRPNIFPISTTTVVYNPISTISTPEGIISSVASTVTTEYPYKCNPAYISFELMNEINTGKYLCGVPYCSTITEWNTGNTHITGNCNCKISYLNYKNTNLTPLYTYSTISYSSILVNSTFINTGSEPRICSFR